MKVKEKEKVCVCMMSKNEYAYMGKVRDLKSMYTITNKGRVPNVSLFLARQPRKPKPKPEPEEKPLLPVRKFNIFYMYVNRDKPFHEAHA